MLGNGRRLLGAGQGTTEEVCGSSEIPCLRRRLVIFPECGTEMG